LHKNPRITKNRAGSNDKKGHLSRSFIICDLKPNAHDYENKKALAFRQDQNIKSAKGTAVIFTDIATTENFAACLYHREADSCVYIVENLCLSYKSSKAA
jgi:hypothetical protein